MVFDGFNWLFFIALVLTHFLCSGRLRLATYYISGVCFVYSYSATSLVIIAPIALLIIGPYLFQESEFRNQLNGFLWLLSWFLYYLLVSNHKFDHNNYFPYEILVLGAYNLARFYHVFKDLNFLRLRGPNWDEILAYLFFSSHTFLWPIREVSRISQIF